jgi:hypothetical protein
MHIRKAVGIELGSTASAAALLDATDSALVVGRDEQGRAAFPSAVGYDARQGRLVAGHAALALRGGAPGSAALPLAAVLDDLATDRRFPLGPESLTAAEAVALVLRGLREGLAQVVNDVRYSLDTAVVAVPASFDEARREAVRQAGARAGLEVAELLPAPAAAAAYHTWLAGHGDATYLVFHAGGEVEAAAVRRRGAGFDVLGAWSAAAPGGGLDGPLLDAAGLLVDGGREALARAGLGAADVDHVILAGALGEAPGLREAVWAALCDPSLPEQVRNPQLLNREAELSTACGAALRAAAFGTRYDFPGSELGVRGSEFGGVELRLTSPLSGKDVAYRLTGAVRAVRVGREGDSDPEPLRDGASVRVRSPATGRAEEIFLDASGGFAQELELQPEADTPLELAVCDGRGEELVQLTLAVRHRAAWPRPEPAPPPAATAGGPELEPPWAAFARLVRDCLDRAADVADRTHRDREELFEHVYAQERYAERAYAEHNQAFYRECTENLTAYAVYLEHLLRDSLPRPAAAPPRPAEEVAREEVDRFRARLAEVWKEARVRGRDDLDARLREVARQADGLTRRLSADPRAAARDARRLGAEVAHVEGLLGEGQQPGGGLLEGSA